MTNQLLRSGTSIGANIHESKYGHGTAGFIAKMQVKELLAKKYPLSEEFKESDEFRSIIEILE